MSKTRGSRAKAPLQPMRPAEVEMTEEALHAAYDRWAVKAMDALSGVQCGEVDGGDGDGPVKHPLTIQRMQPEPLETAFDPYFTPMRPFEQRSRTGLLEMWCRTKDRFVANALVEQERRASIATELLTSFFGSSPAADPLFWVVLDVVTMPHEPCAREFLASEVVAAVACGESATIRRVATYVDKINERMSRSAPRRKFRFIANWFVLQRSSRREVPPPVMSFSRTFYSTGLRRTARARRMSRASTLLEMYSRGRYLVAMRTPREAGRPSDHRLNSP
jgi:hypothetical protein